MKPIKSIKFVGDTSDDLSFKPDKIRDSYYQICQFKNQYNKLYGTRKVIFDEKYDIIDSFEREYSLHKLKKFMKANSSANKYRVYPVDDLKYISEPNSCDLMQVSSDLINRDTKYTNKYQDKYGLDSFNDMAFGGINDNGNNFASPGQDISKHQREVGGAGKKFYNGKPSKDNLMQINNNLV